MKKFVAWVEKKKGSKKDLHDVTPPSEPATKAEEVKQAEIPTVAVSVEAATATSTPDASTAASPTEVSEPTTASPTVSEPATPASADPLDRSVTFSGQAVTAPGGKFEAWSYNPRKLGPNDVEIAISHCGMCASDLHTVSGGWGACMYPCIPGHEIVGTIKQVGSDVKLHKPGDRVGVGPQVLSCLKRDGSCKGCTSHNENLCRGGMVFTYNSLYPDGGQAQGGYATGIRVHEEFAFGIPEALASDAAAPLLCAGVTVFAPLRRYKAGPGVRVGVVGVGGLGHLAVQFAHKMGAHVTAIGSSKKKADEALALGADVHVDINLDAEYNAVKSTLDVVIVTANAKGMNWTKYLSLTAPSGTFCLVALPEEEIKFQPFALVANQINFASSIIGSIEEEKAMLAFAAEHNVVAKIEVMDMAQANEAAEKVHNNDVKFRVVLKN